jgi:hypothetical protein
MPGTRRSTPTAASATVPGSPRPPLVNLATWPTGTKLVLRKERPHPGAQLRFADADGMRVTAFITDTPPGVVPGHVAGLELRHRQHARVEDRIREPKATGLRNLPCHGFWANAAWIEIVLAAADLFTWTPAHRLSNPPWAGPRRDRHLPLPRPARRGPRHPRRPSTAAAPVCTWRWAAAIAAAWQAIRTAFR